MARGYDKGDSPDVDRRVTPAHREVIFSAADRKLARAFASEIKKHLGIQDTAKWREERKVMQELLPMLQTMHEAWKFRRDLYKWWMTNTGRMLLGTGTFVVIVALLYGLIPAIRVVVNQALS